MVSQATQDFAYQLVDTNQEYTTKIIVLLLIFFYSAFMYWYSNRLAPQGVHPSDLALKDMVVSIFMRILSIPVLLLFPLLAVFMLLRGYDIMSLLNLLVAAYVVIVIGVFVYLFIFGWQKLLEMFGITALSGKNRIKMRNAFRGGRVGK